MSAAAANPVLRRLGFGPRDRVVLVHADDVGMCGATVDAFAELAGAGLTMSASVMVPCPWFPAVAAHCRARGDLDVGVHLTLTSEWAGYRWGPVDGRDRATGLLDDDGYFHVNQDRWGAIDRGGAAAEMAAQVDRALAAGIDVTHVDTHMCSALHDALADDYVRLAAAHRVPVLLTREAGWVGALSERRIAAWEQRGLPVFDHLRCLPLHDRSPDRLGLAKAMLAQLPPGLTYFIGHPAADTPELRAIAADWRQRVADFETFRDPELVRHIRALGIELTGWRALRDVLRAPQAAIGGRA